MYASNKQMSSDFFLLGGYFHCRHCSWDSPESLPDRICLSKTVNNLAILCTHSHKLLCHVCLLTVPVLVLSVSGKTCSELSCMLRRPSRARPHHRHGLGLGDLHQWEKKTAAAQPMRAEQVPWAEARAEPWGLEATRETESESEEGAKGVVEWLKCGLTQVFVQRSLA